MPAQGHSSRTHPTLERAPGKADNWVEQTGGLPSYVDRIARHLHYDEGMSISRAIASAVSTVKRWARGGGDVKAGTQAKAARAVAQWEAKKTKARTSNLSGTVPAWSIDLSHPGHTFMAPGAVWELAQISTHGWVPNNPLTALKWRKGSWTPPGGEPISAAEIRSRLGATSNKDAIRILKKNPDAAKKITRKSTKKTSSGGDPNKRQTLKPNTTPSSGSKVDRDEVARRAQQTREANRPGEKPAEVSPDMGRQKIPRGITANAGGVDKRAVRNRPRRQQHTSTKPTEGRKPAGGKVFDSRGRVMEKPTSERVRDENGVTINSGWVAVTPEQNERAREEFRRSQRGDVIQKATKYRPFEVTKRNGRFHVRDTRDGRMTRGMSKRDAVAMAKADNDRAERGGGPLEDLGDGWQVRKDRDGWQLYRNGRSLGPERKYKTRQAAEDQAAGIPSGDQRVWATAAERNSAPELRKRAGVESYRERQDRADAQARADIARVNRQLDAEATRRKAADIPKSPVRNRPRRPSAPATPAPAPSKATSPTHRSRDGALEEAKANAQKVGGTGYAILSRAPHTSPNGRKSLDLIDSSGATWGVEFDTTPGERGINNGVMWVDGPDGKTGAARFQANGTAPQMGEVASLIDDVRSGKKRRIREGRTAAEAEKIRAQQAKARAKQEQEQAKTAHLNDRQRKALTAARKNKREHKTAVGVGMAPGSSRRDGDRITGELIDSNGQSYQLDADRSAGRYTVRAADGRTVTGEFSDTLAFSAVGERISAEGLHLPPATAPQSSGQTPTLSADTASGRRKIREQMREREQQWTATAQQQRAQVEGRTATPSATPRRRDTTTPRRQGNDARTSRQPSGEAEGALFGLTGAQKTDQKARVVTAITGFVPGTPAGAANKLLRGEPVVRRVRDDDGNVMELTVQRDPAGGWAYRTTGPEEGQSSGRRGLSLPDAISSARAEYRDYYDEDLAPATSRTRNAKAAERPGMTESQARQVREHAADQRRKRENSPEGQAARKQAEERRAAEARAITFTDPVPVALKDRAADNARRGVPEPDARELASAGWEHKVALQDFDRALRSQQRDTSQERERLKKAVAAFEKATLEHAQRRAMPKQDPALAKTARGGATAGRARWNRDRRPVYMVAEGEGVRLSSEQPKPGLRYAVYQGGNDWALTDPRSGNITSRTSSPSIGRLRPEGRAARVHTNVGDSYADAQSRQGGAFISISPDGRWLVTSDRPSDRDQDNAFYLEVTPSGQWRRHRDGRVDELRGAPGMPEIGRPRGWVPPSERERIERAERDRANAAARTKPDRADLQAQARQRFPFIEYGIEKRDLDKTEAGRRAWDAIVDGNHDQAVSILRQGGQNTLAGKVERKLNRPNRIGVALMPMGQQRHHSDGSMTRKAIDQNGREWSIRMHPEQGTVKVTSGRLSGEGTFPAFEPSSTGGGLTAAREASDAAVRVVSELMGANTPPSRPARSSSRPKKPAATRTPRTRKPKLTAEQKKRQGDVRRAGDTFVRDRWGLDVTDFPTFMHNEAQQAWAAILRGDTTGAMAALREGAARLRREGHADATEFEAKTNEVERRLRNPRDLNAGPGLVPVGAVERLPGGAVRRRVVDHTGMEWSITTDPGAATVRVESGELSMQTTLDTVTNEAALAAARRMVGELRGLNR